MAALLVAGCNEIVGARRYQVRDGATSASDGGPGDGGRGDANVVTDSGPPPDAGDCDPSELETYYRDDDGDTYGRSDLAVEACSLPPGYADRDGDCNDAVGTAYPGASETCDDVDSDCDGTIDEGLMGPLDAPYEVIPAQTGSFARPAVAAYAGGYLVVSGGRARWLDETGAPASTVFNHVFSGASTSNDQVGVFVFDDTTPPRGVIAMFEASRGWLNLRAFSAVETSTALGAITVLESPAELPDLYEMQLVRLGDAVVVLAPFTGGGDDSALRAGAVNPTTWTSIGSFDQYDVNSLSSVVPVSSSPPSAVVAVRNTDGISGWGELDWLTLAAGGPVFTGSAALELQSGSMIWVPASDVPLAGESLMVFEEDTICLERVTLPAAGSDITLPSCTAAITWEPDSMAMRQGVMSVITSAGLFREEPYAPGTEGTPPVTLPSRGPMAVRDGRGLVVYAQSGALMAQRLGCVAP